MGESGVRADQEREVFREALHLFTKSLENAGLRDVDGVDGNVQFQGGLVRALAVDPGTLEREPGSLLESWSRAAEGNFEYTCLKALVPERVGLGRLELTDQFLRGLATRLSRAGVPARNPISFVRVNVPNQSRKRPRSGWYEKSRMECDTWTITSCVTSETSDACRPRRRQ